MIHDYFKSYQNQLQFRTNQLLNKLYNPLCGMVQEMGFIKRNKFGPAIFTTAADISGVHTQLGFDNPGPGAYHIGGSGVLENESVIKSLAESLERFAQLSSHNLISKHALFQSYSQMISQYKNVLSKDYLDLYTKTQHQDQTFPFHAFDPLRPLSWVELSHLNHRNRTWLPAQLAFVGYQIKHENNEPWYASAVTTGTAAHTNPSSALLNALLEIIQIDSAMGHWYGNWPAQKIIFDERIRAFEFVLSKHDPYRNHQLSFFYIKNCDLPGFCIACLIQRPNKITPRISIGLGMSTSLNEAMYKAFLEAIGVSHLCHVIILKEQESMYRPLPDQIYDLDHNISWYAKGHGESILASKFNDKHTIYASDLPLDWNGSDKEKFCRLYQSFIKSNKTILFSDLSHVEAREVGMFVFRLWSKDTLSLCLPSAPPIKHPRFQTYGGVSHVNPHPYP